MKCYDHVIGVTIARQHSTLASRPYQQIYIRTAITYGKYALMHAETLRLLQHAMHITSILLVVRFSRVDRCLHFVTLPKWYTKRQQAVFALYNSFRKLSKNCYTNVVCRVQPLNAEHQILKMYNSFQTVKKLLYNALFWFQATRSNWIAVNQIWQKLFIVTLGCHSEKIRIYILEIEHKLYSAPICSIRHRYIEYGRQAIDSKCI